jgi:hypothetical protein
MHSLPDPIHKNVSVTFESHTHTHTHKTFSPERETRMPCVFAARRGGCGASASASALCCQLRRVTLASRVRQQSLQTHAHALPAHDPNAPSLTPHAVLCDMLLLQVCCNSNNLPSLRRRSLSTNAFLASLLPLLCLSNCSKEAEAAVAQRQSQGQKQKQKQRQRPGQEAGAGAGSRGRGAAFGTRREPASGRPQRHLTDPLYCAPRRADITPFRPLVGSMLSASVQATMTSWCRSSFDNVSARFVCECIREQGACAATCKQGGIRQEISASELDTLRPETS